MILILICCGNESVKKIRFQQVSRQVIVKLSRKDEMVIGENRTMDFAILSPTILMEKLKHEWTCDRWGKIVKGKSNMSRQ